MIKKNKEIKNQIQGKEETIYSFKLDESTKISISCGNNKIGHMLNWSTLPGNSEHALIAKGRRLTDIEGTCSENCSGCFKNCYARRSILQHHNKVTEPWAKNTLMIRYRMEECFKQIDTMIREKNRRFYITGNISDLKYKFFRINTSGELGAVEELEKWNELAKKHTYMNFAIYTKNSNVVLTFFKRWGQTADNLTINISQWHHVMDGTITELNRLGAKYNIFTYDDSNKNKNELSEEDKNYLEALPHCKAVMKNGDHYLKPDGSPLHCSECQRCYHKTGKETAVYSH